MPLASSEKSTEKQAFDFISLLAACRQAEPIMALEKNLFSEPEGNSN
jgi:hypothetical protein